ncbi:MAG: DNA translocase FtsK [Phycisphaerales bacterium]|nr:DNA translocase FtsK [Phycisphaerales bacterium]
MSDPHASDRPRRLMPAFAALVFCVLLWPALLTFDVGDWPSPHQYPHHAPAANACGRVGAWLAYEAFHYLGDGAYPLALFLTFTSITRLTRGRVGSWGERLFGLTLVMLSTAASVHIIASPQAAPLPVGHGGVVGFALGEFLIQHLSRLGTFIILMSSFCVGLVFATEGWVLKAPALIKQAGAATAGAIQAARTAVNTVTPRMAAAPGVARRVQVGGEDAPALLRIPIPVPAKTASSKGAETDTSASAEGDERASKSDGETPDGADRIRAKSAAAARKEPEAGEPVSTPDARSAAGASPAGPPSSTSAGSAPVCDARAHPSPPPAAKPKPEIPAESKPPVVIHFSRPEPQLFPAEPYPTRLADWTLPSITLLHEAEYNYTSLQESVVREKAKILERTLEEFRLDAHVVEIDTGPVITMFELRLAPGIKVSQIASLSNDIARALKAPAIRVVAPIPGKNTVGVEVPNVEKEKVRLKELMLLSGEKSHKMGLPLFIGKDASGAALVTDLTKAPHMLIAGTTGSGKSVCMNSIIVSLLMTKPPDEVKLILVDPKMVEMSQFKEVPHLMCPIVTDMERAEKILEWAVTKMDERYEFLAEAGVRNISAYNALSAEDIYQRFQPSNDEERRQIPTHLPYIVIMIDELADLMMTSAKEVEHHLSRLAQKSRAVGIHIVVATQRPEAKVVTGLIKSNLPCRICFRVASRMDSRIVLDQNGGEVLMGQGDMLYLPPGSHKLLRAQGTFLEDAEIHTVLDDLAQKGQPQFHPELIRMNKGPDAGAMDKDPLFDEAVRIVLETKRGSVSLLQRRLNVGYSRASRLIDLMGEAGIVGTYKGSQAREVMITLDEWEQIRAATVADMGQGYAADEEDGLEATPATDGDDGPF